MLREDDASGLAAACKAVDSGGVNLEAIMKDVEKLAWLNCARHKF